MKNEVAPLMNIKVAFLPWGEKYFILQIRQSVEDGYMAIFSGASNGQ